jgi:hypothetical protein
MDLLAFLTLSVPSTTSVAALIPSASTFFNRQHSKASFPSLNLFHESDTVEQAVSLSTPSQELGNLLPTSMDDNDDTVSLDLKRKKSPNTNDYNIKKTGFDIDTTLFCAGLAFDSYVEPPSNSSRWERGVCIIFKMEMGL